MGLLELRTFTMYEYKPRYEYLMLHLVSSPSNARNVEDQVWPRLCRLHDIAAVPIHKSFMR